MSRNRKRLEMAFPCVYRHPDGSVLNQWTGMTLRDYAAIKFMAALISTQDGMANISRAARESKTEPKMCAALAALEFADAFLAARGKS